jgi:putative restriction endonuclease
MTLTPQTELRLMILAILDEAPGKSTSRSALLSTMSSDFAPEFSQEDKSTPMTRPFETKWANRASFERAAMVRDGLLREDAAGEWALTQAGASAARSVPKRYKPEVARERIRRRQMWADLQAKSEAGRSLPVDFRALRFYAGQAGIFMDKAVTQSRAAPGGAAVSFVHTGRSYADELTANGVIYHFPSTERTGHDKSEIKSAIAAFECELPVFVIAPGLSLTTRTVHRGFIESVDMEHAQLLITFESEEELKVEQSALHQDEPFFPTARSSPARPGNVRTRPNQLRFAFDVFARYGSACVGCGLKIKGLIQAAHVWPKSEDGSDDARNGLPMCANHHLAFDGSLWVIHPETLQFASSPEGPTLHDLGMTETGLHPAGRLPHEVVLNHSWAAWLKKYPQ